jgi:dihydropteroate synthase
MGIVNVTPDSFFPDGRSATSDLAIQRGREMLAAGADIVDVGGESTRPGADDVSVEEEIARVVPVVRELALHGPVSIDTQKAEVARAAVAVGASVINDVSASLMSVAGELGVGYVGMHRQGTAQTMQIDPHYDNVVLEVRDFLARVAEESRSAGVTQLWLDPGIGFGKTAQHNIEILAHLPSLRALCDDYGCGLLIGTSRKRFLGTLSPLELEVDERLEGSIATEAWSILHGADMVRVHDVPAAVYLRELVTMPYEEVTT